MDKDLAIKNIRRSIIEMAYYSNASHIGSALSIVDILYVLYFKILNINPDNPDYPNRDRFILSKAHASMALYSVLAHRGFFPPEYLEKYSINGGILPCHLDMTITPGIDTSAGSLGHGLSIGVGMAIANKSSNVYVILGDGECNEGSVWEAVMLASTLKLNNLTAIVDNNKLQAFGSDVINQENLAQRFQAFGWEAHGVDGHNADKLETVLKTTSSGPKVLIAHTIKGKGISFMENQLEWHYKSLNEEQYKQALEELEISQELQIISNILKGAENIKENDEKHVY